LDRGYPGIGGANPEVPAAWVEYLCGRWEADCRVAPIAARYCRVY